MTEQQPSPRTSSTRATAPRLVLHRVRRRFARADHGRSPRRWLRPLDGLDAAAPRRGQFRGSVFWRAQSVATAHPPVLCVESHARGGCDRIRDHHPSKSLSDWRASALRSSRACRTRPSDDDGTKHGRLSFAVPEVRQAHGSRARPAAMSSSTPDLSNVAPVTWFSDSTLSSRTDRRMRHAAARRQVR